MSKYQLPRVSYVLAVIIFNGYFILIFAFKQLEKYGFQLVHLRYKVYIYKLPVATICMNEQSMKGQLQLEMAVMEKLRPDALRSQ